MGIQLERMTRAGWIFLSGSVIDPHGHEHSIVPGAPFNYAFLIGLQFEYEYGSKYAVLYDQTAIRLGLRSWFGNWAPPLHDSEFAFTRIFEGFRNTRIFKIRTRPLWRRILDWFLPRKRQWPYELLPPLRLREYIRVDDTWSNISRADSSCPHLWKQGKHDPDFMPNHRTFICMLCGLPIIVREGRTLVKFLNKNRIYQSKEK